LSSFAPVTILEIPALIVSGEFIFYEQYSNPAWSASYYDGWKYPNTVSDNGPYLTVQSTYSRARNYEISDAIYFSDFGFYIPADATLLAIYWRYRRTFSDPTTSNYNLEAKDFSLNMLRDVYDLNTLCDFNDGAIWGSDSTSGKQSENIGWSDFIDYPLTCLDYTSITPNDINSIFFGVSVEVECTTGYCGYPSYALYEIFNVEMYVDYLPATQNPTTFTKPLPGANATVQQIVRTGTTAQPTRATTAIKIAKIAGAGINSVAGSLMLTLLFLLL